MHNSTLHLAWFLIMCRYMAFAALLQAAAYIPNLFQFRCPGTNLFALAPLDLPNMHASCVRIGQGDNDCLSSCDQQAQKGG
mmetsp:Transcript_50100/g.89505  ORF Transcript_50100/g.89505 Transcript_50100/m.89505 type:complete len:81 (+) Transcript_50100:1108-1350(+)